MTWRNVLSRGSQAASNWSPLGCEDRTPRRLNPAARETNLAKQTFFLFPEMILDQIDGKVRTKNVNKTVSK